MSKNKEFGRLVKRWGPAVVMMATIFGLSSRPAETLPHLGWADTFVKKGGHMLGYAALAVTCWRAMGWKPRELWAAWALAAGYGLTDELHQLFVAGRHPSVWDVIFFDAPGALMGLLASRQARRRRSIGVRQPEC